MDSSYIRDLRLLKSTFSSGNEANVISKSIAGAIAPCRLRVLDVGFGDGRATLQAIRDLTAIGYQVQLTGLDLYISPNLRLDVPDGTELIESDFFEYPIGEQFDVVLCTQSLYYLGDYRLALHKLLQHIRLGGCLLVTIWTGNCLLHDLHTRFVSALDAACITAEDVAIAIRSLSPKGTIELVRTQGSVSIHSWLKTESIGLAAFRVITRAIDWSSIDAVSYAAFCSYLSSLPKCLKRENGTVIFRHQGEEVLP
jgi:SAM-dependent methyltransferase